MIFERINKAREELNRGDFKYNGTKLNDELNFANKINKKFSEVLKREVIFYERNYSTIGENLISKFVKVYKFIVSKEKKLLSEK